LLNRALPLSESWPPPPELRRPVTPSRSAAGGWTPTEATGAEGYPSSGS
jgi:hypothetical protein